MPQITCFLATDDAVTAEHLMSNSLVDAVYTSCCFASSADIRRVASRTTAEYTLIYNKPTRLEWVHHALHRLLQIAADTGAVMLYSDRFKIESGEESQAPVIDYQPGSLRDDFDFGSVIVFKTAALKAAVAVMDSDWLYAGLYDLRLHISRMGEIVHVNEFLYYDIELDSRHFGEKIFDYVDPRNRGRQIEMEKACTEHLKEIGGYLPANRDENGEKVPNFRHIEFDQDDFEVEATVMIPVRNRIRTIRDAIDSVLKQECNFKFNLMVVDNFSTDGTREAIAEYNDPRLIHIIADYYDMGIGGYWNLAAHRKNAGKFIVQLDSDDMYKDEHTLQTMVDAFYEQNVAMVVGTYQMTDIHLNPIPPGIVDHREWTPSNGRNNALRINGLGAPRAFYTPVLREVKIPNTSYGEDYALGLNISRNYQIGRVYDPVYLCRRWDDNSDASLDVEKMNRNNLYKDRIRTWELQARIALNKKNQ